MEGSNVMIFFKNILIGVLKCQGANGLEELKDQKIMTKFLQQCDHRKFLGMV